MYCIKPTVNARVADAYVNADCIGSLEAVVESDVNNSFQCSAHAAFLMASSTRLHFCVTGEPVVALKKAEAEVVDMTPLAGNDGHRRSKRRRRRPYDGCEPSKWRRLPLSQTGFVTSLLPRQSTFLDDSDFDELTEHESWSEVPDVGLSMEWDVQLVSLVDGNHSSELDQDDYNSNNCSETSADVDKLWLEHLLQEPYDDISDFDSDTHDNWRRYGESVEEQTTSRPLRAKKKWHTEKAHRQLKTRHCRSLSNCVHGVSLYVNHRVLKRMTMVVQPTSHRPCSVTLRQIDKEKSASVIQDGKPTSIGPI